MGFASWRSGVALTTTAEIEIVRKAKERFAYVALDFDREIARGASPEFFELPDGQTIKVRLGSRLCLF